jgi:hypothetical protein
MFKKLKDRVALNETKSSVTIDSQLETEILFGDLLEELSWADETTKKEYIEKELMPKFIPVAKEILEIKDLPQINLLDSPLERTFGIFKTNGVIDVVVVHRHPMDSLRTLAHELVHWKQNLDGVLNQDSAETGSEHENEANSKAGVIMRHMSQRHPELMEFKK